MKEIRVKCEPFIADALDPSMIPACWTRLRGHRQLFDAIPTRFFDPQPAPSEGTHRRDVRAPDVSTVLMHLEPGVFVNGQAGEVHARRSGSLD